jgi:hypothetical protein
VGTGFNAGRLLSDVLGCPLLVLMPSGLSEVLEGVLISCGPNFDEGHVDIFVVSVYLDVCMIS